MSRGGESCGIEALHHRNNCSMPQENFFLHNPRKNLLILKKLTTRGIFYLKEHGTDFALLKEKHMDYRHEARLCLVDKLLAIVILIGRIDYEI